MNRSLFIHAFRLMSCLFCGLAFGLGWSGFVLFFVLDFGAPFTFSPGFFFALMLFLDELAFTCRGLRFPRPVDAFVDTLFGVFIIVFVDFKDARGASSSWSSSSRIPMAVTSLGDGSSSTSTKGTGAKSGTARSTRAMSLTSETRLGALSRPAVGGVA